MNTESIKSLHLLRIAEHSLGTDGFITISQLAELNEQELLRYHGIGRIGFEKIKNALELRGLKLNQTNRWFDFDKDMSVRASRLLRGGLRKFDDQKPISLEEIKVALLSGKLAKLREMGKKTIKEIYRLVEEPEPPEKPKCCPFCKRPYA